VKAMMMDQAETLNGANLWKYFRVLHRLSTSHEFVQIGIEGKQVIF
jgi:hypothetical protein